MFCEYLCQKALLEQCQRRPCVGRLIFISTVIDAIDEAMTLNTFPVCFNSAPQLLTIYSIRGCHPILDLRTAMPDILCDCARCFKKDDHLRLLPLRTVNGHVWQHGRPTEEQLQEHAQELASREASEARKNARVAAREQASACAQEEERDRRRQPEPTGQRSEELGDTMLDGPSGNAGVEEEDRAGGRMSERMLGEGGVAMGSGARDQAAPGGPQYFSGVDTVKIRSMDATNVARDYHDNKTVNTTNVFGRPDKPADEVSSSAHLSLQRLDR